jgi:hypothetical protein
MTVCSGCGGSYEDKFTFCPYCGKAKPVVASSAVRSSGVECPLCHKDDKAAKVTSIVQSETHRIDGSVPISRTYTDSAGNIRSDRTTESFSATQVSELGARLGPPGKPRHNWLSPYSWWGFKPTAILIGLFSCFPFGAGISTLVAIISGQHVEGLNATAAIAMLFMGVLVLAAAVGSWLLGGWIKKKGDKVLKPRMDAWERAIQQWNSLYYCSRDDCVYLPGTNRSAPIYQMMEFIHK